MVKEAAYHPIFHHPIAGLEHELVGRAATRWWYWSTTPSRVANTQGETRPDWTPLSNRLRPIPGEWIRFRGPSETRRTAADIIGGGKFTHMHSDREPRDV